MFAINIEDLKTMKLLYIFKETLSLSFVYSKGGHELEKIFKENSQFQNWKILD